MCKIGALTPPIPIKVEPLLSGCEAVAQQLWEGYVRVCVCVYFAFFVGAANAIISFNAPNTTIERNPSCVCVCICPSRDI